MIYSVRKLSFDGGYVEMKKIRPFVISFLFAMCLGGCSKESAPIGIIGGADGPTAIFVTSSIHWLSVCGWIGAIILALLVAVIIYGSKKKK